MLESLKTLTARYRCTFIDPNVSNIYRCLQRNCNDLKGSKQIQVCTGVPLMIWMSPNVYSCEQTHVLFLKSLQANTDGYSTSLNFMISNRGINWNHYELMSVRPSIYLSLDTFFLNKFSYHSAYNIQHEVMHVCRF